MPERNQMSKIFTISDREVKSLRDIQVAFKYDDNGNVTILQLESHSEFTGYYETLDFHKLSPRHFIRLEQICKSWVEAQDLKAKEYEPEEEIA